MWFARDLGPTRLVTPSRIDEILSRLRAEIADESISSALADANRDGIVNLLAYAMIAGPSETVNMPHVKAGPDYLTITFDRHTNASEAFRGDFGCSGAYRTQRH